jgi:hypothetical protein
MFTENVVLFEISENDIVVEINGPLSPYEFTYKIDTSTGYIVGSVVKSFRVRFKFASNFYGENMGKFCE